MTSAIAHALGILSLVVFAGAGAVSLYAIAASILPRWRKIWAIATGRHLPPSSTIADRPAPPRAITRGVHHHG